MHDYENPRLHQLCSSRQDYSSAQAPGALKQIIEWRGAPEAIRGDNGPEYDSGAQME